MKTVGLLPAAGSASRIQGLPKFLLPINDKENLISKHVTEMLKVCDEVVISTRAIFAPLVEPIFENSRVKVVINEPSNMVKTLNQMISLKPECQYLVGMPDTFFKGEHNVYLDLNAISNPDNILLAAFPFRERMRGLVGQINFDENGLLTGLQDKIYDCDYKFMWGAFSISRTIPEVFTHPGAFFDSLIVSNETQVNCVQTQSEYYDLGTVENLVNFYKELAI